MKTALIVIDMQNDYLWEKRQKQFTYDTEKLTANVNAAIGEHKNGGGDVIYIRHIIQNLPTNRLLFGFSIAGSKGAELYDGLEMASDLVFDKLFSDPFAMPDFLSFMKKGGYDGVILTGLDECGCVRAAAKGAVKRGFKASILTNAVGSKFPENKLKKCRSELNRIGVKYI